jgi:malonyl-CoA O-methyltransferase
MLDLHKKDEKVFLREMDFDEIKKNYYKEFDFVISSSSLQWSKDIFKIVNDIQKNSKYFAIALFCDGTFKTLRERLGVNTFLPNSQNIMDSMDKNVSCETKKYSLKFNSPLEQLRYIKRSGVSGGVKKLSVKEVRNFIKNYDKKELEFEVLFMTKTP